VVVSRGHPTGDHHAFFCSPESSNLSILNSPRSFKKRKENHLAPGFGSFRRLLFSPSPGCRGPERHGDGWLSLGTGGAGPPWLGVDAKDSALGPVRMARAQAVDEPGPEDWHFLADPHFSSFHEAFRVHFSNYSTRHHSCLHSQRGKAPQKLFGGGNSFRL
jgi:hypothetical protein